MSEGISFLGFAATCQPQQRRSEARYGRRICNQNRPAGPGSLHNGLNRMQGDRSLLLSSFLGDLGLAATSLSCLQPNLGLN